MAGQNNIAQYAKAIQAQLKSIVGAIPVYGGFNRNFADEKKFITWQLRNVHQEVYTGTNQNNKGIDRPTFQISIFTSAEPNESASAAGFDIANTIIQALHGYSGQFGGTSGFYVSKADVVMLYHGYDNTINLFNIFLDCTLDIQA